MANRAPPEGEVRRNTHGRRSKSPLRRTKCKYERGYERAAFENATRLKISRTVDSCFSLSLSLSFSFVLCVLRVYLCLDENRAFRDSLLNINVDDEPAVLSRHEKYLKESSDIDFFNLPRMQKMEGKKTADCISSKKHPDIVFPGRNFLVRNIEKRPTLLSGLSVSFNAEEKQKYSPSKIK